jgi:hypothetical protein
MVLDPRTDHLGVALWNVVTTYRGNVSHKYILTQSQSFLLVSQLHKQGDRYFTSDVNITPQTVKETAK